MAGHVAVDHLASVVVPYGHAGELGLPRRDASVCRTQIIRAVPHAESVPGPLRGASPRHRSRHKGGEIGLPARDAFVHCGRLVVLARSTVVNAAPFALLHDSVAPDAPPEPALVLFVHARARVGSLHEAFFDLLFGPEIEEGLMKGP